MTKHVEKVTKYSATVHGYFVGATVCKRGNKIVWVYAHDERPAVGNQGYLFRDSWNITEARKAIYRHGALLWVAFVKNSGNLND